MHTPKRLNLTPSFTHSLTQEKRIASEVASLERDTGYKLRVRHS